MSLPHTRVVVWGDPGNGLEVLRQKLSDLGLEVHPVASFEDARAAIHSETVELVVSWLGGGFVEPLELLTWLQTRPAAPPVLIVAAWPEVDLYLEAMRRGAFDCVGLPLDSHELARIVARALESCCARSVAEGG